MPKIGRHDPCSCSSGLTVEKCCGRFLIFNEEGYSVLEHFSFSDATQPEVGGREGEIIVKVQMAMNDPTHPALIYDRGQAFRRLVPPEQVAERMSGRPKVFFHARLSFGQLVLGAEAPHQRW